jgi:hypothetical protein
VLLYCIAFCLRCWNCRQIPADPGSPMEIRKFEARNAAGATQSLFIFAKAF